MNRFTSKDAAVTWARNLRAEKLDLSWKIEIANYNKKFYYVAFHNKNISLMRPLTGRGWVARMENGYETYPIKAPTVELALSRLRRRAERRLIEIRKEAERVQTGLEVIRGFRQKEGPGSYIVSSPHERG